jgi:hypothetical protein
MQVTDQNFDIEDLQEAPTLPRTQKVHPVLVGVVGSVVCLALAVMFIRGSLPEMTPEQIVAMEGYQGQQPPRYIFNIDSIESAPAAQGPREEPVVAAARDVVVQSASVGVPKTDTAEATSTNSGTNTTEGDSVNALLAIETEEPRDSWALEIVEVPASPIIVGKDAQEVSAPIVEEFDYRKLNRKPSDNTSAIRVLPVLTVNTDNTLMRAKPSESAEVTLVMARGASVTAFEQSGVWVHVGANDGSSTTGYIHQSNIAAADLN